MAQADQHGTGLLLQQWVVHYGDDHALVGVGATRPRPRSGPRGSSSPVMACVSIARARAVGVKCVLLDVLARPLHEYQVQSPHLIDTQGLYMCTRKKVRHVLQVTNDYSLGGWSVGGTITYLPLVVPLLRGVLEGVDELGEPPRLHFGRYVVLVEQARVRLLPARVGVGEGLVEAHLACPTGNEDNDDDDDDDDDDDGNEDNDDEEEDDNDGGDDGNEVKMRLTCNKWWNSPSSSGAQGMYG